MRRIYLVPLTGTGLTRQDAKKPKYFSDLASDNPAIQGAQILWYGLLLVALFDCPNMDQATHDAITANADVVAFPQNLNAQVGANLAVVQASLDQFSIPSGSVTATTTYLDIINALIKLFNFANQFHYWFGQKIMRYLWDSDVKLNQLPGDLLSDIQLAADNRGIDTAGITAAMTIKQAIAILSQRL
jgi:hypothetical protein